MVRKNSRERGHKPNILDECIEMSQWNPLICKIKMHKSLSNNNVKRSSWELPNKGIIWKITVRFS